MKFTKTILPNGVRVLSVPMQGNPTVTVMVNVATGAFNEAITESGISHFLEHMCFKGTSKRPTAHAISVELDSIGAGYNAFTSREITGYWAKADVKHFAKIADVVSDIFKNSTFPEGEIEKEKGVVVGEIDMYADDPQEKIYEALLKHMFKGEPAERDVLGTKETVRSFTKQDLISYRTSQYTPKNTVVAIAGGVSESDMIAWASSAFSDIKDTNSKPEFPTKSRDQKTPEMVFIDKDTDQSHIILAWRTFDRSNPDRYVASIVRNILRAGMSSRLYMKLREELGSGYYISASHSMFNSFGYFTITTGTSHDRVPEIVAAIIAETEKLKTELVSEAEIGKVKEFMRAHLLMGLETSDDVADFVIDQEIIKKEILLPEDYEKIYAKITPADVMRVAKILFDSQKLTVAAIGKGINKATIKKNLEAHSGTTIA